jgi:hypothetical protein
MATSIFSVLAENGSAVTNAVGDYSGGSADSFNVTPPATEDWYITRMIFSMEDSGTFDPSSYGNGTALTNGVVIRHSNAGGVLRTLTAFPPKTNIEWEMHCHDVNLHTYGTGDEGLTARWTFAKHGRPLLLNGADGEFLEVYLNDSFTHLVAHRFLFQGYSVPANTHKDSYSPDAESW